MKILVAAASHSAAMSGVQRHAFNLVRCLLCRPETTALHLVVAPWQLELVRLAGLGSDERLFVHVARMGRGPLARNFWYYLRLPEMAAALDVDLVHLSYPVPVDAAAFACPTVLTLHDLYPYENPANFGIPRFLFNRVVLRQCLSNADSIACVSDATLHSLEKHAGARVVRKAVRVYNCVEPVTLSAAECPLSGWKGEPFLLSVAQHRRNKNIPLLIRSFLRLLRTRRIDSRTQLVIVGIDGPETAGIFRLVAASGLSGRVRFLAGLPEPDLQWCYAHCQAVAAPSSTEGFGLPVAEALLAGCSVVCSDIPAFREIGGGLCRFFSLQDNPEEVLAAALAEAVRGPAQAPAVFPHLSAPVLGEQYMALYRRLIAGSRQKGGLPARLAHPRRDNPRAEACPATPAPAAERRNPGTARQLSGAASNASAAKG